MEVHPRKDLALVEVKVVAAAAAVVVAVNKLGVSCQQEVTCQVEKIVVDHMLDVAGQQEVTC